MNKTLYYCDVCEKETDKENLHEVEMEVTNFEGEYTNGSFDACRECLTDAGVLFNQFGSYNCNRSMEEEHGVWLRWLKKFLRK